MAERSAESPEAAGLTDRSSAISRTGMLVGDIRSVGEWGTKENPVTVPLALRLTSAVTFCQLGLLAGSMGSPFSRWTGPVRDYRFTPRALGRERAWGPPGPAHSPDCASSGTAAPRPAPGWASPRRSTSGRRRLPARPV